MKKYYFLLPVFLFALFYIGKYFYMKPKYKAGEKVVSSSAELMNGEKFNLSELKGKYILMDFWGSWCGPCRAENPALVQLNQFYKNKKFSDAQSFEILSIAVETNKGSWLKAIAQDQLNWKYHVIQTSSFQSAIPLMYGVREIPTKYLLNTDGSVLMTNPSFQQLIEFLNSKVVSLQ
jgi:thiol-disulfide isomerase/thioredoxin